jgi:hypothetical protein
MRSNTMLAAASALLVSFACGCAAETENADPDEQGAAQEPQTTGAVGTAVERQVVNPPGYNPPGYNPAHPIANPPGYNPPGTGVGVCAPGYNTPGYNPPGYNPPGTNPVNPALNPPGYNPPGYNPPGC